ncbi:hypothetical protein NH340_JMT03424 [Sarcoptes scabiei]|nr:hypothetical protein NH340_JMT03424 [Sarcoptes scabiei]
MIQTIHFELEKIMYNNNNNNNSNNNNNNDQIRVNKEWQNNERSTSIDKHRGQCQQPKRSFIMSLGTFLGIGRYGGHISSNILNDTSPTLRFALKQMLDFSLFGVSLIGFPVGWQTDSSKKFSLNSMRKWIQFASIQPFMMMLFNGTERIEEIVWSSLKTTIRSALKIRYQLLPYYYTLMFRASKEGRIFLKPLFFQFGSIDQKVYKIDEQFMIGDALMVSPSLESDPTEIEIYFPEGRWYNYYNGRLIWNSRGGFVTQSTVNLNLHLRGGFLIPLQDSYGANTLEKIRIKNGYKFIGGYNHSRMASGELYIDNGIDRFPPMQSLRINIFAHYRNVTITVEQRGDYCSKLMNQTSDQRLNTTLEMIKLFGLIDRPQNHSLRLYVGHRRDLDLENSLEFIRSLDQFFYDSNFGILTIVMDLDFCFNHHFFPIRYYFLNWTYTDW